MNLEPGWEKKALIILAVVTCVVIIYSYGSLDTVSYSKTNQTIEQLALTSEPQISPASSSNPSAASNSTNYNLTTNNTNNSQNQLNTTSNALQQTSKAQSSLKTV
ncbi:hypothetical protein [Methanobacterium sp. ACI-7]|uniref:hypothetical protein n=1 Tax=unclassified Methanobacterium TaxID=2627676 RepID=UPI0039C31EBA